MRKQQEEDNKRAEAGISFKKSPSALEPKKSLKFFLSKDDSQDSFVSALSTCANSSVDEDDDNETVPVAMHVNLSKLTFNPRFYAKPRIAKKKNCVEDSNEFILNSISSHTLYRVSSDPQCSNDVNMRLIHAIYLRKINEVKNAIENGANVNYLFSFETPLLIATEIGDADMISYLLTVPGININQKNGYGQAALSVAVRNSFDLIVSLLLNVKADVNTQDHLGRTPLHSALFQEKRQMVYRLLAFEADVEVEDCFGERAIYTAAVKKPNMECLRALLEKGASINYLNFSKVPLISRVIMNATDFSIIEILIEYGASVNETDLTSKTPLHYAALSNHLPATKILIENGASIHVRSLNNFTPLDEARSHNNTEVIMYLESLQPRSSASSMRNMRRDRSN